MSKKAQSPVNSELNKQEDKANLEATNDGPQNNNGAQKSSQNAIGTSNPNKITSKANTDSQVERNNT